MPFLRPKKMRDGSRVLRAGEKYDPEKAAMELSKNSQPALKMIKRIFNRRKVKGGAAGTESPRAGSHHPTFEKGTLLGVLPLAVEWMLSLAIVSHVEFGLLYIVVQLLPR